MRPSIDSDFAAGIMKTELIFIVRVVWNPLLGEKRRRTEKGENNDDCRKVPHHIGRPRVLGLILLTPCISQPDAAERRVADSAWCVVLPDNAPSTIDAALQSER